MGQVGRRYKGSGTAPPKTAEQQYIESANKASQAGHKGRRFEAKGSIGEQRKIERQADFDEYFAKYGEGRAEDVPFEEKWTDLGDALKSADGGRIYAVTNAFSPEEREVALDILGMDITDDGNPFSYQGGEFTQSMQLQLKEWGKQDWDGKLAKWDQAGQKENMDRGKRAQLSGAYDAPPAANVAQQKGPRKELDRGIPDDFMQISQRYTPTQKGQSVARQPRAPVQRQQMQRPQMPSPSQRGGLLSAPTAPRPQMPSAPRPLAPSQGRAALGGGNPMAGGPSGPSMQRPGRPQRAGLLSGGNRPAGSGGLGGVSDNPLRR